MHPCQSWPAVYRLMRKAPFILHICRYDSQSFLRIGVLPSPCMVVIGAFIEIHNVQGYL